MKSNKVILSKPFLYFLIFLQTMAVLLFAAGAMDLLEQVFVFKGTDNFIETETRCVRSKQYGSAPDEVYNNTYEFTVDEDTYQVTFYGEKSKGKNRTLYYNPAYPPTCSKYKNLWIALLCNSVKLVFGVIVQIFFVRFLLKRRKANPYR